LAAESPLYFSAFGGVGVWRGTAMTITKKEIDRLMRAMRFAGRAANPRADGKVIKRERVLAYDRRDVAMHEAGHIVAARHLGLQAEGSIYSAPASDDPYAGTWDGHTYFGPLPTPAQKRKIAVAGTIAQRAFRREWDYDWWLISEDDEADLLSPTDWRNAGREPGTFDPQLLRAIKAQGKLLRRGGPLWGHLLRTARRLIILSRPANEPLRVNEIRSTLKSGLQTLGEIPEEYRPEFNIEDMRSILAGRAPDRDDCNHIVETVATAFVWRQLQGHAEYGELLKFFASMPGEVQRSLSLWEIFTTAVTAEHKRIARLGCVLRS
jgi:hypothetical protein